MIIQSYKMPKTPIDYSNTVIYKIVCNDINVTELYVGHTTNFVKRKAHHKYNCQNPNSREYNLYVYQYIRANGFFNNWNMIEIEKYPCNNLQDACKRERYWLEQLKATLNKKVPSRTRQEYQSLYDKEHYKQNKETILKRIKVHYEQNKEEILKRVCKKYNCQCGSEYRQCDKARHCRTAKHQNYLTYLDVDNQYEYYYDDGTPCTKEDYDFSLLTSV